MKQFACHILWISKKDLHIQFRQPTAFLSTLMFCLLLVFIFSLSLNLVPIETVVLAPALIWIILLFGAVLGMTHTFAEEKENDCIQALSLAVCERSCIFLGKGLANIAFLLVIECLVVPILFLFLDLQMSIHWPLLLLSLLLGGIGLALLGTLFNSLLLNQAGLLLPILLLPIAIPLLIGIIELTKSAFTQTSQLQPWLLLVVVFNLVMMLLGVLLADYLLEV